MNEATLKDFEMWASELEYDLSKAPCTRRENPFAESGTWKAYEAWCASKVRYESSNV